MNKKHTREDTEQRPAARGVELVELDSPQTQSLLERFVGEFVDLKKQEALLLAIKRRPVKQRPIDYEKYLRSDRTIDVTDGKDFFRWLSAGRQQQYCYFFQREAFRPASRIRIDTLDEPLASSWPGIFVNFDAGRTLAVTPDLYRFQCDIR